MVTLSPDRELAPEPPTLRLVRPMDGPSVSVVLATQQRRTDLDEALPPLAVLCAQLGAELVVIGSDVNPPLGRPVSRHARYMSASADASISQMRELAMSQCNGDIVVLLDDSASRSWIDRVRACTRKAGERPVADAGRAGRAPIDWTGLFSSARAHRD